MSAISKLKELGSWKPVEVGLAEPSKKGNHYDITDDNCDDAAEELEDSPDQAPGIFFGLEVLTDYEIQGGVFKEIASTGTTQATTKKKKKKKQSSGKEDQDSSVAVAAQQAEEKEDLEIVAHRIQETWSTAAGVQLPLNLCRNMKSFESPTPIQQSVLPPAIFGRRNILGAAPTGSGKTLAFLLPVLYDMEQTILNDDDPPNTVHALIITPTRELAKQIYAVAKTLTNAPIACLTGGLAKVKQERVLSTQHPRIITGTPGRLWDMIADMELKDLKFLILDEADRLVHERSFPELKLLFGKLQDNVSRQTFVFSATLTLPGMKDAREILTLAHAKGETKTIDLSNSSVTKQSDKFQLPEGLTLQFIPCIQMHKDSHLYAYIMTQGNNTQSTLVFCNSIAGVRRVHGVLQTLNIAVKPLHANMTQRARFQAVEFLAKGNRNVVVATDVAARGLDWINVHTIVHYDAARTIDGFVHRAGRTARGVGDSAVGCSVSLISSSEDRFYKSLMKKTGISLEKLALDSRILALAQERVNLASKIANFEDEDRKRHRDNQWFIDNAAEAGLEIDEDLLDDGDQLDKRKQAKRSGMAAAKQQLRIMLSEPMRVQRYGKFLSTNMSATQSTVPEACVMPQPKTKRRRKRK